MSATPDVPEGPRPASPREMQAVIQQEREGRPFLVHRDDSGELRVTVLSSDEGAQLSIGRSPQAGLCIGWDGEVSGLHAQVELVAGDYTLADDGLSRNGSFVNGERVRGRRRLRDGDMLRFGQTHVQMRVPIGTAVESTIAASSAVSEASLSPQQRKVLTALCRPLLDGNPFATPATNQEIADELFLTVDAIKVHLRALFDKFDVAGLPQNKKRLALVGRAMQSGVLNERE